MLGSTAAAAGSETLLVDSAVVAAAAAVADSSWQSSCHFAAVLLYLVFHFCLIPVCQWPLVPSSAWLAFLV